MAYRGINTYILGMKQETMELVKKYLNLGVPLATIQIMLEATIKDVEFNVNKQIIQEDKQYQEELKAEAKQKEEKPIDQE